MPLTIYERPPTNLVGSIFRTFLDALGTEAEGAVQVGRGLVGVHPVGVSGGRGAQEGPAEGALGGVLGGDEGVELEGGGALTLGR